MDKYQNKYRIGSARLKKWDYRNDATYFITICTQGRECFFGGITDGKMNLSAIGIIADVLWYEITNHAKNVELGAFVVMPNHIHGILILNGNDIPQTENILIDHVGENDCDGAIVETLHATSLQSTNATSLRLTNATSLQSTNATSLPQTPPSPKNEFMSNISPKSGSVSTILRSYKSAVTKHSHRLGFDFGWQERFYDHIIRDEQSFQTITEYIINNPSKWRDDKFYME